MVRSRAAAAAGDVYKLALGHGLDLPGHLLRSLVVASHLVRQTGVRVAAHGASAPSVDLFDQRHHFDGTERAVETECRDRVVTDGSVECFQGLARERAAASVTD